MLFQIVILRKKISKVLVAESLAVGAFAQLLFRFDLVEVVQFAVVQRAKRMFEMYTSGVQAERSVSRTCGEHVRVSCLSCLSCYLCETHRQKL